MLQRTLTPKLLESASQYPVVTILGPRQSGKTTLARALFPSHTYVDLEDPDLRALAREDPKTFFAIHPEPLLLDEIQRVPELLSRIKVLVDADRSRNGRFILTGSHQPRLREAVSQSLAGRTAELDLLPLSLSELPAPLDALPTEDLILRGFLPGLWLDSSPSPADFHRNYFRTYVERDVRTILEIRHCNAFEKFLHLLAGRVGQLVNCDSLAGEVGVSAPTIAQWLSVAEASFVVFRLPPWFANVGKRFVKSPKLYFTDVGLAAWLLGIETPAQLARDPLRGNLFENLVVAELLKTRTNAGREPNLYFARDSKGFEVDVLYPRSPIPVPVEIKSARTFDASFAKNLNAFSTLLPAPNAPPPFSSTTAPPTPPALASVASTSATSPPTQSFPWMSRPDCFSPPFAPAFRRQVQFHSPGKPCNASPKSSSP